MTPRTRRPAWVPCLLLLAVTLVSACRTPAPSEPAEEGTGDQTAEIEALDVRFSPRTIEYESGSTLTVTVQNKGRMRHTFSTDGEVDLVLAAGETKVVTFVPQGRMGFFCRFHESEGMKGALCPRGTECQPPLVP